MIALNSTTDACLMHRTTASKRPRSRAHETWLVAGSLPCIGPSPEHALFLARFVTSGGWSRKHIFISFILRIQWTAILAKTSSWRTKAYRYADVFSGSSLSLHHAPGGDVQWLIETIVIRFFFPLTHTLMLPERIWCFSRRSKVRRYHNSEPPRSKADLNPIANPNNLHVKGTFSA